MLPSLFSLIWGLATRPSPCPSQRGCLPPQPTSGGGILTPLCMPQGGCSPPIPVPGGLPIQLPAPGGLAIPNPHPWRIRPLLNGYSNGCLPNSHISPRAWGPRIAPPAPIPIPGWAAPSSKLDGWPHLSAGGCVHPPLLKSLEEGQPLPI